MNEQNEHRRMMIQGAIDTLKDALKVESGDFGHMVNARIGMAIDMLKNAKEQPQFPELLRR